MIEMEIRQIKEVTESDTVKVPTLNVKRNGIGQMSANRIMAGAAGTLVVTTVENVVATLTLPAGVWTKIPELKFINAGTTATGLVLGVEM